MLEIAKDLERDGRKTYVMPSGGSDEVGALGYARALHEIAEQLDEDGRDIGCIIHPCGSGGTYVGAFFAWKLAGIRPRLVAAICEGTIPEWQSELADYVARTAKRWSMDLSVEPAAIELISGTGRGYAINTDEELDFIAAFARRTGIFLDPVYTGKALYALDRDIRAGSFDPGGNVLFIHTGGIFSVFPERAAFADAIARWE